MKIVLEHEVEEKTLFPDKDISTVSDQQIKNLITRDPLYFLVNANWTIFRH